MDFEELEIHVIDEEDVVDIALGTREGDGHEDAAGHVVAGDEDFVGVETVAGQDLLRESERNGVNPEVMLRGETEKERGWGIGRADERTEEERWGGTGR